jgi:hypothetical protein
MTAQTDADRLFAELRRRLRPLGSRRRQRVLEELRDHVLCAIEADLARGNTQRDAEHLAVARFGDPEVIARLIEDDQRAARRRGLPLLVGVTAMLALFALLANPVSDLGPRSAVAAASCDRTSATQAVQRFFEAFNTGNQQALRSAIAPATSFAWYSVPGPNGRFSMQQASNRASLFTYFRLRHEHAEQMQLTRVDFHGIQRGTRAGGVRFGDITFTLTRQARDVPSTIVSGKGSVLCGTTTTIAAWSQAATTLPGMGALDPIQIAP